MEFHVYMEVIIPENIPAEEVQETIQKEKEYALELQRQGKWTQLWRIVGEYANFSIFEVEDNNELHQILSGLPLFKWMKVKITPLADHPSKLSE